METRIWTHRKSKVAGLIGWVVVLLIMAAAIAFVVWDASKDGAL